MALIQSPSRIGKTHAVKEWMRRKADGAGKVYYVDVPSEKSSCPLIFEIARALGVSTLFFFRQKKKAVFLFMTQEICTHAKGYIYTPNALKLTQETLIGFGEGNFYIKTIPKETASAIIREHHYSKKVTISSYVHLGIFVVGQMKGVLQFGHAMTP